MGDLIEGNRIVSDLNPVALDRHIEGDPEKQFRGQVECTCGFFHREGQDCPWCQPKECVVCGIEFVVNDEYEPIETAEMDEAPEVCHPCHACALPEPTACIECGRDVPADSDVDLCEFCAEDVSDD